MAQGRELSGRQRRQQLLVRARAGHKCWQRSEQQEMVPNILKGGEDSIGFNEAVQRVYINIGSCSEQAWVNHLVDLRQADPEQRLFHQTPFDIGQARRDCANFRAIEDRLPNIVDFLVSERPTDLYARTRPEQSCRRSRSSSTSSSATAPCSAAASIFAEKCARCHASKDSKAVAMPSSVALDPIESRDFLAEDPDHPGLRLDWLGNDELTAASEVGTYRARALHSNHMTGSRLAAVRIGDSARRPPVADLPEPVSRKDGGRGYYRNISLLSVWAHAPFLHNNAHRAGAVRPGAGVGSELGERSAPQPLSLALCRCQREGRARAGRQRQSGLAAGSAEVLAVRSERRRSIRAVQGIDELAAQSEAARSRRSHALRRTS